MLTINEILEKISYPEHGWGEFYLRELRNQLDLIKIVEENYEHIDQLERLIQLYSRYNNSNNTFDLPSHKDAEKHVYALCEHIARVTKSAHYGKLKDTDTIYHINNIITIVHEHLVVLSEINKAKKNKKS